jgi:hypothetical protein
MKPYLIGPGLALAVLLGVVAGPAPAAQAQSAGPNPESGAQMQAANRNAGFDDGCETARSSRIAPVKHRDEAAYAASESYRSGWSQGYTMCKPSMDNTPERLLGDPLGRRW